MPLGLAVVSAAYYSARPAARAPPRHGACDTLSCRHRAVTACEPPVLDERQAAIMKAQGYQWDAERRRCRDLARQDLVDSAIDMAARAPQRKRKGARGRRRDDRKRPRTGSG